MGSSDRDGLRVDREVFTFRDSEIGGRVVGEGQTVCAPGGGCSAARRTWGRQEGGPSGLQGAEVGTGPWEASRSATDSLARWAQGLWGQDLRGPGAGLVLVLWVAGAGDPAGHPRGSGGRPPGHWMGFSMWWLGLQLTALQWYGPGSWGVTSKDS